MLFRDTFHLDVNRHLPVDEVVATELVTSAVKVSL